MYSPSISSGSIVCPSTGSSRLLPSIPISCTSIKKVNFSKASSVGVAGCRAGVGCKSFDRGIEYHCCINRASYRLGRSSDSFLDLRLGCFGDIGLESCALSRSRIDWRRRFDRVSAFSSWLLFLISGAGEEEGTSGEGLDSVTDEGIEEISSGRGSAAGDENGEGDGKLITGEDNVTVLGFKEDSAFEDDLDTVDEEDRNSTRGKSGWGFGLRTMRVPVWSYPVKGFYFFFRNGHRLWHRVARFVAEVILAIVGILFTLFYYTFPTQRDIIIRYCVHWLGVPGAIALIILETAIAIVILFQYRLESAQRKLFLDVLAIRKVKVDPVTPDERAWINERLIPQLVDMPAEAPTKKVARQKKPSRYLNQVLTEDEHPIMNFLITLPLNFIPVLGNAIFCWLNSFPTAISLHHYYYTEMKGLTSHEFSAVVHAKKPQYQYFGFVASAFSLVPGLDVILVLTNAVGAALWAADMEKTQGSVKTKWVLDLFDKGGRSYGTFNPSSSGESSRC